MKFQVIEHDERYQVVSEDGRVIEWFDDEEDADTKAEWLTQEYERVLSIL